MPERQLWGANDWVNIGLPASGPGSPPAREFAPDHQAFLPGDLRQGLTKADLDIRFVTSALDVPWFGDAFSTVQVLNRGPASAQGVEVEFSTTAGVELIGVPTDCTLVDNVGTCPLGTLGPGALEFLDVVFRVLPDASGTAVPERRVDAVVTTAADSDPKLDNNTASLTLNVTGSCELTSYEAEDVFHSAGGAFTGGWKLWTAGAIKTTHAFTGQPTLVTVRAKGQKSGFVWPSMTLRVGGVLVGTKTVSSSFYQDYVFEVTQARGDAEVEVSLANPSVHGDRILFVDRIEVECEPTCEDGVLNQDETDTDCGGSCGPTCEDGEACLYYEDCEGGYCDGDSCTTVSCTDGTENGHEEGVDCGGPCPEDCASCDPATSHEAEAMFHSTGSSTTGGWSLWSNGYVATTHGFANEPVEITVRAKGDAALGVWPHMVVSVAGATVGSVFVTSTSWAEYRFEHTPASGSQEVRIAFDNDYYAPPHDRNLHLDQVTISCAPTCTDLVMNGAETDQDCGGGECPTCPNGAHCELASDCQSGSCSNGFCQAPSPGYGFESGVSGWTNMDWPATATSTVSSPVYSGTKALKVTVNSTGAGAPRVWVLPATSPPAGATMTYHVYFPAGAPIYAVQPYVADKNWVWRDSWNASPPTGSWRTLTVTLPSNFAGPAREVGMKVYLNGNVTSYNGVFYVDQVGW